MTSIRSFIAGIIYIVAIFLLSAPPSFSADEEIKAIQEKVNALEKKINRLELDINQRFMAIEKKISPSQQADIALEKTAKNALSDIRTLISKDQISLAKTKLSDFFKKYGSTRTAYSARKLSQELSVFGMDAPENWGIVTWFQGEDEINFEKQSTMLLFFWETWCGYCRQEAPEIQKIYTGYKEKGLKVIGLTKINKSATIDKVIEFIDEKALAYPIAQEDGSLSQYFKVHGIPASALIYNGKVVWRGHPSKLSDQLLQKYLKIQDPRQAGRDKEDRMPDF